jgi:hypothetical protein
MNKIVAATAACCLLAFSPALWAQTYAVKINYVSGPCGRTVNTEYTLTVNGNQVEARSEAGSGFTAQIQPDGSFKASFESFQSRNPMSAEGNVKPGQRILKITNIKLGCVWEGK